MLDLWHVDLHKKDKIIVLTKRRNEMSVLKPKWILVSNFYKQNFLLRQSNKLKYLWVPIAENTFLMAKVYQQDRNYELFYNLSLQSSKCNKLFQSNLCHDTLHNYC